MSMVFCMLVEYMSLVFCMLLEYIKHEPGFLYVIGEY